jgi:hypothetical protein
MPLLLLLLLARKPLSLVEANAVFAAASCWAEASAAKTRCSARRLSARAATSSSSSSSSIGPGGTAAADFAASVDRAAAWLAPGRADVLPAAAITAAVDAAFEAPLVPWCLR